MNKHDEVLVAIGTIVFLVVMSFVGTAEAKLVKTPCNQVIYDAVYRQAVRNALNASTLTENDIALKNYAIQTLRQLCRGQRSTYEKKNNTHVLPYKKVVTE